MMIGNAKLTSLKKRQEENMRKLIADCLIERQWHIRTDKNQVGSS